MKCPTQFSHFNITEKGIVKFFVPGDEHFKISIENIDQMTKNLESDKPNGWFDAACLLQSAVDTHKKYFPDFTLSDTPSLA